MSLSKSLIMRTKSKHCIIFVSVIVIFFFAAIKLFLDGYRLTPVSAAHCVRFTQPIQQDLLLEYQISSDLVFYLLDTGDSYHTIYSCRVGPLWKSYYGVGSNRSKNEDIIELQTKFWLDEANVGWIVSTSHDPNVASFKISYGEKIIAAEALKDEPTVIIVPAPNTVLSGMDFGFDAVALSKDDVVLYRLNYLMEKYHVTTDYGWYPVLQD